MKKPTQPVNAAAETNVTPVAADQPTLRRTFTMTNLFGRHDGPGARLVETLRPFACDIKVEHDGAEAKAHSVLGLMALAVGFESQVTFTISGNDAPRAMAAVKRLFDTRFQQACAPGNKLKVERWQTQSSDAR